MLSRVVNDLKSKELFNSYDDVFFQQLSDGVIEKLQFDQINVCKRVWIPHRPILKFDELATTKVRPVLNCSLKIGNAPSLNQASYPGVNLLNDLLSLLLYIRTNEYLVVVDIRQAFHQIRLFSEFNNDKFTILWQFANGQLKVFVTTHLCVQVFTRRSVLSKLSRTFDLLGLYLPVSMCGKIPMRKLWQTKVEWDKELSIEFCGEWSSIKSDFYLLLTATFLRRVLHVFNENILVVFCDTSKSAYGFASYGVYDAVSNLLFAKAKAARLKTKTLATLELLATFLAVKCLRPQLSVHNLSVSKVYICSDSQVALSWVLTRNVKSKNQFANNRVKDICEMLEVTNTEFNVPCYFRYCPTELKLRN